MLVCRPIAIQPLQIFQNSIINLTDKGNVEDILKKAGLFLKLDGDNVLIEEPLPGSPLFQEMKTFDFYADTPVKLEMIYLTKTNRMPKEIFYLPALLILILIYLNQVNRKKLKGIKERKYPRGN